MVKRVGRVGAVRRRIRRWVGLCVVVAVLLGLSACDVGPVVLEGTLTHADTGEPLAGVPVRVFSSTEETVVARGRTGEDGVYRFQAGALPAGTYRVVFSGDHWWEDGTSWATATDVAISSGQSTTLDAALVPTTATLWGDTLATDGYPYITTVEVLHADTGAIVASGRSQDWGIGDPVEGHPCSGRASVGCYEFDLPAGDVYNVRLGSSFVWGSVEGDYDIELGTGGRQVNIAITHVGFLEGRVVGGDGDPVAGARVIPFPGALPPTLPEATTDADGAFSAGVEAHRGYRLLVVGPDGGWTFAGMVDGVPETATQFSTEIYEWVDVGDIVFDAP